MNIRDYLDRAGMTQAQFAEIIGVTQQAVNAWVSDGVVPRKAIMDRLVRATNGAVQANDFHAPAPGASDNCLPSDVEAPQPEAAE